jgi:toxin-antitoxin system PIN domain toxin
VTLSLPDVNVWIALAAEGHIHHVSARAWFAEQPDASVAFCRITQMGLLRLLTNPNVMGRAPRTIGQAWDVFTQLRRDRRLLFMAEPEGVESVWRGFMTQPGVGPSSWTDAYLAEHIPACW